MSYGNYDAAWIGSALAALSAALIVLVASVPRHRVPRGKVVVAGA
ncbi:MAG: hypothetical protein ACKVQU_03065 [Burkholderiales bacterium]